MNYYDITDLINHARFSTKVSGIQRVVLEVLKKINGDNKVFFISPFSGNKYIVNNSSFHNIDDLHIFRDFFFFADIKNEITNKTLFKLISMYFNKNNVLHKCIRKFSRVTLSKYNPLSTSYSKLVCRFALKKLIDSSQFDIVAFDKFKPGNSIILFGGVWNFQNDYEIHLEDTHKCNVVFMLYDMIPIVCDYVPDELKAMFNKYVPFMLRTADKIIVNSESCKNDLNKYIIERNCNQKDIYVINLAHNLSFVRKNNVLLPLRTRKLSKEKYALCVGSIESRKNHLNLLILWRKFINSEQYANEKLVIVGRLLWDSESVVELLRQTGNLYGTVFFIESASEEELDFLYKNCRFSVFASHYEGWGLPLGESLHFKKPCLHFDNSSLKEAGYGMTTVVPYLDYKQFYICFSELMNDEIIYNEACNNIDNLKLRSWNDFTKEIFQVIEN